MTIAIRGGQAVLWYQHKPGTFPYIGVRLHVPIWEAWPYSCCMPHPAYMIIAIQGKQAFLCYNTSPELFPTSGCACIWEAWPYSCCMPHPAVFLVFCF